MLLQQKSAIADLIEGDGYIYAPDPQDFSTKQKWVAHIEIVFDIKDIQLYTRIK